MTPWQQQLVRDIEELPGLTADDIRYAHALLKQRSQRRQLTEFERALARALAAEIRGEPERELARLTLVAARAARREAEALKRERDA